MIKIKKKKRLWEKEKSLCCFPEKVLMKKRPVIKVTTFYDCRVV